MGVRLFVPRAQGIQQQAATQRQLGASHGPLPEAAALLLIALALYFVLALASLHVDVSDPTVTGPDWVGPVGAACARLLAQGFGGIAWLVPVELSLFAAPLLRHRRLRVSGLRLAGDLLIAIVAAALVHVALPTSKVFGGLRIGGNVGLIFGELFSALFSTAGSYLIGATIIGLVLIGRSEFSFIELCERTALGISRLLARLRGLVLRLRDAWREARRVRGAVEDSEPVAKHGLSDESLGAEVYPDRWVPLEKTGRPPLALANSLRTAFLNPETLADSNVRDATVPTDAMATDAEPALGDLSPLALSVEESEAAARVPASCESASASADPVATKATPARRFPQGALSAKAEAESETAGRRPLDSSADADLEEAIEPANVSVAADPHAEPPGEAEESAPLRIVDTQQYAEVERPARRRPRSRRGRYELPSTEFLHESGVHVDAVDERRVHELARRLEATLADYGVTGKVEEVHPGPTVTTYEISPQAGTKVSKVAGLSDDLALGLSRKVRIIAPIPGKARIGFEIPNDRRTPVNLRELIEDERFEALALEAPLPVVLGRNIVGAPFFADLAAMPHVIVAGATGAGKSVGLNVMLSSLLFKRSPDELRMLMIDPKVVELAPFDGIPHMLLPVVTDMKQAAKALKWAVDEMERRYQAFASAGTKNITTYNQWADRVQSGELSPPPPAEVEAMTADGGVVMVPAARDGSDGQVLPGRMPHIVIVVDEFADLMMQQGKEVEASVARLAQKARAAGMHVVLATQRPSVDVITGMIKANFPTRIAFRVAQKVDSRTILDEMGAELLLGKGDMLVKLNGSTDTHRVQCPFVSEEEVNELTAYLRTQGAPEYRDIILRDDDEDGAEVVDQQLDARYDEAVAIVAQTQRCSTSWLQRKMTIGYNRAAKIVESMEANGVVGPANGAKDREIFVHDQ